MSEQESTEEPIRIVVGVDFTEIGDHALAEAIRYARRIPHAEIHPVHVVKGPATKRGIADAEQRLGEAAQMLRARVVDACEADGASWDQLISFHTRLGDPAEALHQAAVDVDADLIVVGTHGRQGLAKVILGSVAQKLVETAHCAVMVARPCELAGLPKSDQADPPRPGETLTSHERVMQTERIRVVGGRGRHIGGLI